MDRLLSSSKDKSLSESESAPGGGKVRRRKAQQCLGEGWDLGNLEGGYSEEDTGLGTWGPGESLEWA